VHSLSFHFSFQKRFLLLKYQYNQPYHAMKNYQRTLLIFFFFCGCSFLFAQEGTVSGVLEDPDGPLPGVSVLIKGTTRGTDTDFDGKYSIRCKVGDVLVFSYLGYRTREVTVTPAMFDTPIINKAQTIPVRLMRSDAYKEAIQKIKKDSFPATSFSASQYKYNKKAYNNIGEVKNIKIDNNLVKLDYFGPNIYYEIGYNAGLGIQFVKKSNLPQLQNTYSQGQSSSGALLHFGPETDIPFSYGPALNLLEYDGSNYLYDTNGRLVRLGNGNGVPANAYDNSILAPALKSTNHLFFTVLKSDERIQLDLIRNSAKDIFNVERSTDHKISLNYKKDGSYDNLLEWNALVSYRSKTDNQPNINGFQNNLLLNAWATPPSFSNLQGTVLPNNVQRRFASQFNNPNWLLDFNRNRIKDENFVASLQNEVSLNENIKIESDLNFSYQDQLQQFGVFRGTTGFEQGFLSDKHIVETKLNATSTLIYDRRVGEKYNQLFIKSKLDYKYDHLDFSFVESSNVDPLSFNNPQNRLENLQRSTRSRFSLLNQFLFNWDEKLIFDFVNNSYVSSLQNNKWFLPTFALKINFIDLLDIYGMYDLSLSSNISFDVNDLPLYYRNLSHNSLLLSPEESLRYTSNNDLFLNPSVALEERRSFEINSDIGILINNTPLTVQLSYYNTKSSGSVFPIISNNTFELQNVADIRNSGFELTFDSHIYESSTWQILNTLTFSTFNTKVLSLLGSEDRVPIAGFSTTSQNLIVGQPAGVIVGSAYARDAQNNIIIGDDGFPLVSPTPEIIGNPVPDFNISFNQKVEWKKLEFEFVLEGQKGGDIWNGTQNVLNYLGTSQQSAVARGTTNFVFDGVTQQGAINTVPVDFYNPNNPLSQNRFVRYGFEGVAEDAIEDASYFNLRSVNIQYRFEWTEKKHFFREMTLGLYANNLFSSSRFRGRNPFSSLYGNTSGQELNFFNTPLVSEVGFTLHLKI